MMMFQLGDRSTKGSGQDTHVDLMSSIDIVQMSLDGIKVVALLEDDNVVILEVITRGGQGGE